MPRKGKTMNKKEQEQFKQGIVTILQEKLGIDYQINLQTVLKTNVSLDGLSIRNIKNDTDLAPTFYLNDYYNSSLAEMPVIAEQIILAYQNRDCNISFKAEDFLDFEKVKANICCKLINYSKNEKLLEDVPYISFLDLAIVFYVLLDIGSTTNASALIHNSHLKHWNVTKEVLETIAYDNTKKMQKEFIQNLNDVLLDMLAGELPNGVTNEMELEEMRNEITASNNIPMYILTNEFKINGSIFMTDVEILEKFANKNQTPLVVIIPSSTHEVLLIPVNDITDYQDFNKMVEEVNHTALEEQDILSNHCYLFEQKTKEISML